MSERKNFKLGVVLSKQDVEFIEDAVDCGAYLNISHFIREAVRDKIKREKQAIIQNNKALDKLNKIVNERKLKENQKIN